MPVPGTGYAPSGVNYNELTAITRRAEIPKLVYQFSNATPLLSVMMRNAQRAAGGLAPITVHVQGNPMTVASYIGYSGAFQQPTQIPGIQNAEFNLSMLAVPIQFIGADALIQSTEAMIPRLRAVMADAFVSAQQKMGADIFTNNTANPQAFNGLAEAYDDGTNVTSYGGISRATNTFWKSTLVTSAGGVLSRAAFITYLVQLVKASGGEAGDFVVMSPGDWATLMEDYMTAEQFNTNPSSKYGRDDVVNAGFRGLMLADTPVFMDYNCPLGTAYIINTRYLAMYIHENAFFAFSGFYSAIPNNQISDVGVMIHAFNVICSKPKSGMQITGITGGKTF